MWAMADLVVVDAVEPIAAEVIVTRMLALNLHRRIALVQWLWQTAGSKKCEK